MDPQCGTVAMEDQVSLSPQPRSPPHMAPCPSLAQVLGEEREGRPSPALAGRRRQEAGGRNRPGGTRPSPPTPPCSGLILCLGRTATAGVSRQLPASSHPFSLGARGAHEMQAHPAVTLRPLQHSGPFSAGPCPSPHLMLCGPRAPGSRSQTDVGFPGPPWAFLSPIRP